MKNKIIKMDKNVQLPLSPRSWANSVYIKAASSDNTRKAYRSDIRHFENWGGRLPATIDSIINYLEFYARQLNPRTMSRRLIALQHWHTYQGFADPTAHPSIKKVMLGITRIMGKPKNKAHALTLEEIMQIACFLNQQSSLAAYRDNALLQMGFFAALRRSELVTIKYEHIKWEKEGIEILLPSSKTDPLHEGQVCVIPHGNDKICPIKTLEKWLSHSQITQGAIFRRILKDDQLGHSQLTPLSVNHILKKRAVESGLEIKNLSSHSLRRGLATSAARAGTPLHILMRAGRWKQAQTVMEYLEISERFAENAAATVLKNTK